VIVLWLSVIGMMINGMFMDLRFFGFGMAFLWFILGMIDRLVIKSTLGSVGVA
jgi:hypothetical protein